MTETPITYRRPDGTTQSLGYYTQGSDWTVSIPGAGEVVFGATPADTYPPQLSVTVTSPPHTPADNSPEAIRDRAMNIAMAAAKRAEAAERQRDQAVAYARRDYSAERITSERLRAALRTALRDLETIQACCVYEAQRTAFKSARKTLRRALR